MTAVVPQFEQAYPQAQSNVVRLPTAATRKVKQPCMSRKYFAAKAELPKHPADYMTPQQRKAMKSAETLIKMGKSAELFIATAIFQTMDREAKAKVQLYCALAAETDEGAQANEWLRLIASNYGDSTMVKSCMKRLAAERGL